MNKIHFLIKKNTFIDSATRINKYNNLYLYLYVYKRYQNTKLNVH